MMKNDQRKMLYKSGCKEIMTECGASTFLFFLIIFWSEWSEAISSSELVLHIFMMSYKRLEASGPLRNIGRLKMHISLQCLSCMTTTILFHLMQRTKYTLVSLIKHYALCQVDSKMRIYTAVF